MEVVMEIQPPLLLRVVDQVAEEELVKVQHNKLRQEQLMKVMLVG